MDGIDGILNDDYEIAKMARESKVPTVLVMNKSDANVSQYNISDFYKLGFDEPQIVSAEHSKGIESMLEKAFDFTREINDEYVDENEIPLGRHLYLYEF